MADQRIDFFAPYTYGKLALQKMKPTDPDFRLFYAGWLGKGNEREVMRVTGAKFREAKNGPNKGQLSIMVPDTKRSVLLTAQEMADFEAATKPA